MVQDDIYKYMKKVNRPITKKELNFLNVNPRSITRGLCTLKKYKIIDSKPGKYKKPSLYFFK